jgi:hypothetical protein
MTWMDGAMALALRASKAAAQPRHINKPMRTERKSCRSDAHLTHWFGTTLTNSTSVVTGSVPHRLRGCPQADAGPTRAAAVLPYQASAAAASSDGAPWESQIWKEGDANANRHSCSKSSAMACTGPLHKPAARHFCNNQFSNASGAGSSCTAWARRSRLTVMPMASGVVSRFRRLRRPSDASSAANSWRQTSAGRRVVMVLFRSFGPGTPAEKGA